MARPIPISQFERLKDGRAAKKPNIAAKEAAKPAKRKKSSKKDLEEKMLVFEKKYREYRALRDAVINSESDNINLTGNITG
jgi:hypothetical protein